MFDLTALKVRYFELKLKNGKVLEIEAPKLKVLKKIMSIAKVNKETVDDKIIGDLGFALSLALSKNKQNEKISADYIIDNLNIDEIQALLTAYFNWVRGIQDQKN